jgi:hypothetical protein
MDSLPKSLFEECAASMKTDEFISSGMDTHGSMSAIAVGNPRIDSHLLAKGLFSVSDLSTIYIPDDSITPDEIRKIVGYLLDCQVSRFEGYSVLQNVLTCVYLHRDYEIKNPVLKSILYGFVPITLAIEEFVRRRGHMSLVHPGWVNESLEPRGVMPEVESEKIEAELIELKTTRADLADVIEFVLFEIRFAKYLGEPSLELEYVAPPAESEAIGFVPEIHFRDLPFHTPPPRAWIPGHEQAITTFRTFIEELIAVQSWPFITSVRDLIAHAFRWGVTHQHSLMFLRMRLMTHIFPLMETMSTAAYLNSLFMDTIKTELLAAHFPTVYFEQEAFQAAADQAHLAASETVRACVLTPSQGYAHLCRRVCKIWAHLYQQVSRFRPELVRAAGFPKISNDEYNAILQHPGAVWATLPMADLVRYFFELGIACELYKRRDYPTIFAALAESYSTVRQFLEKKRTADSIYIANAKRKPNKKSGRVLALRDKDVLAEMGEPSRAEMDAMAMSDYMMGCFHAFRFALCVGAFPLERDQRFYDQEKAYNDRINAIGRLTCIGIWKYEEFSTNFRYDDRTPEELKDLATRKLKNAFAVLGKVNPEEKTPERQALIRKMVMSSVAVSSYKTGQMLEVEWEGSVPRFLVKT